MTVTSAKTLTYGSEPLSALLAAIGDGALEREHLERGVARRLLQQAQIGPGTRIFGRLMATTAARHLVEGFQFCVPSSAPLAR